jgi:hypothetical protein
LRGPSLGWRMQPPRFGNGCAPRGSVARELQLAWPTSCPRCLSPPGSRATASSPPSSASSGLTDGWPCRESSSSATWTSHSRPRAWPKSRRTCRRALSTRSRTPRIRKWSSAIGPSTRRQHSEGAGRRVASEKAASLTTTSRVYPLRASPTIVVLVPGVAALFESCGLTPASDSLYIISS